ncbi:hypothetical protein O181_062605 [Austropuccinia psidii MF-1]|uniref:Uncharacterized protein n=1 Tax=Austropuccinia psidii MF-1 TaxID=1389203 RepID=A0A9Q3EPN0_9BASI|nr:hypothetical protein [Austropuccinia psidii MF-1]
MAAKKFENFTGAGITEEDESKGIKSMSEKLASMCPFYAEMDSLFGHKPNVTPIASYDLQEKDNLDVDDDDDGLLNKDENLVPVENLQDESKSKSITHSTQKHNQAMTPNLNEKSGSRKRSLDVDNAPLEWDRERWNEEKVSNMEKQWFEEVKLQRKMEFAEKQHAKKHEFEKEKWNWECKLKEKHFQMDLTIAELSSSRPILELEQILTLINKK